jgi:hypothetical protein
MFLFAYTCNGSVVNATSNNVENQSDYKFVAIRKTIPQPLPKNGLSNDTSESKVTLLRDFVNQTKKCRPAALCYQATFLILLKLYRFPSEASLL